MTILLLIIPLILHQVTLLCKQTNCGIYTSTRSLLNNNTMANLSLCPIHILNTNCTHVDQVCGFFILKNCELEFSSKIARYFYCGVNKHMPMMQYRMKIEDRLSAARSETVQVLLYLSEQAMIPIIISPSTEYFSNS